MNKNIADKWNKIYQNKEDVTPLACSVLQEYSYLLPNKGKGLDLACGGGGNAFLLASKGLDVDAVDISDIAIGLIQNRSKKEGLQIKGVVHDVESQGLLKKKYDVIVVSYFLNRALFPEIISHLSSSGLLFYQTWTVEKGDQVGPRNPDFLLQSNELLQLCRGMNILHFQDEGQVGNISYGKRNGSMIVAMKS